jgi:DNA-binding NtrC family response regulator
MTSSARRDAASREDLTTAPKYPGGAAARCASASTTSALVDFFIKRYSARFHKDVRGVAESTLTMLSHYWWPGNIRELENLVERLVAVVDHEYITDEDLPFEFHVVELDRAKSDTSLLDRAMGTFERNFLVRALERNAWNVTQTARYLGVPLSTLKFKMERLEIRELARKIKK